MSLREPILCVVGARPNYMKMAPIIRAFRKQGIPSVLLHTGQHYDPEMNDRLFADLHLPHPDLNLEVGSASHAVQTAEIMRRFEPIVDAMKPSAVLVVGDVNSTIACSLVAAKKRVPVIHVEAGLRSFDRAMPEEINRVLTDQLAELLYTTERSARENLVKEGIDNSRIHFVGNVMIDSLRIALPNVKSPGDIVRDAGLDRSVVGCKVGFGVVTLHRPSNVDDPSTLEDLIGTLNRVANRMPLVFPVHPRTRGNLERFRLISRLGKRLFLLPPQGYLEMLGLMSQAAIVLTDSGGMQEETTALAIPCLTLRENTERPITVEEGTNTLTGRNRSAILAAVDDVIKNGGKRGRVPEFWDGNAAERIALHIEEWFRSKQNLTHHGRRVQL